MICFEILMLGFWKNSLVCLQALFLSHLAVQWKSINFLISFLKKVVGRGSHGSGPGELRRAPFWLLGLPFHYLVCHGEP